jgi:anti-anti-sigma factor
MDLIFTNNEEYLLVKVQGKLDATTAGTFQQQTIDKLHESKNVIIDFSELEYISSAGLRAILVIGKQLASDKRYFALFGLKDTVLEIFKISGFYDMLNVFDTFEEVKKQLKF